MIKSFKVMLHPNNKQRTRMFQYANACRYSYNWAIEQEKKAYERGERFIEGYGLIYLFVEHKKQEGNEWLKNANAEAMNVSILDAVKAFKSFFKGCSGYPQFKRRKRTTPSFYQPTKKIKISETHVSIQGIAGTTKRNRLKLNYIKLAKRGRIPVGVIYHNPRFTFDGLNWWFSVSVEMPDLDKVLASEGIGIDLGIKDLAITSNGDIYPNINRTVAIRKTQKKLKRVQRQISRKYLKNKEGEKYKKTKNIVKLERETLKLNHRLHNIRTNYIHHITSELARIKPAFVVMEDLNVKGMMKNRHLARAIQEQLWGEFYRQMKYKSEWVGSKFITVEKWFPSSKLCSECGRVNRGLKWSDRLFVCPDCGHTEDRDEQASKNLKNYGIRELVVA